MSGHTPGPWYVADGQVCATTKRGQAELATVHADAEYVRALPLAANARLMATAPELLEALKAMLGMDNPDSPDAGHVDYVRAVAMGRKAVAKAEGR